MHNENPLVLDVFNILSDTDKSISLYQLMRILEAHGYELVKAEANESSDLLLFKKNFIVMNALYQLKHDLLDSGVSLRITSLEIKLEAECLQYDAGMQIKSSDDISADMALSDFYLNWGNYYLTDEKGVEELLNGFWNSYSRYNKLQNRCDKRLDSLHTLGLKSTASWKDIQQTYRQLVSVYHPDKGGNSPKFIKIREAYLILKLTRSKSH